MVIVAAVDRSEQAKKIVSEGAELANAFEEQLDIVHVMTRSEFTDIQRSHTEEHGEAVDMDTIAELAENYAKEAVGDTEVPYETVGLVGDASSKVVQYAEEQNARYIVTGGRKRSPTGKAVFGSVSQSIILDSNIPVVSVVGQ